MKNSSILQFSQDGGESGRKVADRNKEPSTKSGLKAWRDRVKQSTKAFRGAYGDGREYMIRIQVAGSRRYADLGTADLDEAAKRARSFYFDVQSIGWAAALQKLHPARPAPSGSVDSLTVGEYLAAVKEIWIVRELTYWEAYGKFRRLVSLVLGFEAKAEEKWCGPKRVETPWQKRINAVRISALTPAAVTATMESYLKARGGNAENQLAAKHTINSLVRNSRSLFSRKKIVPRLKIGVPEILPFDGVRLLNEKMGEFRFQRLVDVNALIVSAHEELAHTNPQLFTIFLLAIGAGLRRGEIDRLRWRELVQISQQVEVIKSDVFDPKSYTSLRKVKLPPQFYEIVLRFRGDASLDAFVNFAVWIDLLDHGVGREHGPKAIWTVIRREFTRALEVKNENDSARSDDDVPRIIESWLNQNKDRRILLLLDEADRFLGEDAREDFREARRLKGIMDRTSRRFKVVFAGLHNVQRTTQQANHPLAHLGDPINVGALSQSREWYAAFALASEPLTALGVRFSSADLVSRILTICNFYPGLIQQFCSRLWRRLIERRMEGPPFTITETELDEVYRDPELRKDIVGRFKLTLQLDPRYWHLAHIVALQFLEKPAEAEAGYLAAQLRQFATDWWQDGFVKNSPDEFRSLLDEMCDLGVLRLVGDRYSFRNANILLLLGSQGDVESELLSGPRKIVEYTPRSFRARRKRGDTFLRRPLTLSEESRLSDRTNGVAFVIGSKALGLDDVAPSLSEIAHSQHFQSLRAGNLAALERELSNIQSATRNNVDGLFWVWVPANLQWTQEWVEVAENYCDRLRSSTRFIKIIFEASPDLMWSNASVWARRRSEESNRSWLLKKWTADFMGPWLMELGVPTGPEEIEQMMNATGGWPALAQDFAKRFVQTNDWRKALKTAREGGTATHDIHPETYVGAGEYAKQAMGILKQLRQNQIAGEKILDAEIAAHADLIQITDTRLRELLDVAEMLSLIDRQDYAGRSWDPVFERMLLS